jgi:hypothetical protein
MTKNISDDPKHLLGQEKTDQFGTETKDMWQTPLLILERVRKYLGAGYFDPCPADPEEDGLKMDWGEQRTGAFSTVFINPPYSQAPEWVRKGLKELASAPSVQCWLLNNNTETAYVQSLLQIPHAMVCLPNRRISFIHPATGKRGPSPRQGQIIIGVHNLTWPGAVTQLDFRRAFEDMGVILEATNA